MKMTSAGIMTKASWSTVSPPIDHWYTPFCEKHAKQERSLYYFYKHVKALWCGLDDVYDLEDVHTKYTALSYLAVGIASREAHRDWFFPAIQSLWDCLEGVQVIELLDRSQATSIQLQDHRFQHQDSQLFAPQPAEVDWDAVRQEWE
ncbi:hypothetical protein PG995_010431 [Apiospora arundinis]